MQRWGPSVPYAAQGESYRVLVRQERNLQISKLDVEWL